MASIESALPRQSYTGDSQLGITLAGNNTYAACPNATRPTGQNHRHTPPHATPGSPMNPTALAHLRAVLERDVAQGLLPGAVALVQHRGHTVLHEAVGRQRPGAGSPAMALDTVFRI